MPNEKIKVALKKLHSELSDIIQGAPETDALSADNEQNSEDGELQDLLTTVADDIDVYLKGSNIAASNKHGFAHRLEEIATDFSIEHPNADSVLKEIRKILLSIGA